MSVKSGFSTTPHSIMSKNILVDQKLWVDEAGYPQEGVVICRFIERRIFLSLFRHPNVAKKPSLGPAQYVGETFVSTP